MCTIQYDEGPVSLTLSMNVNIPAKRGRRKHASDDTPINNSFGVPISLEQGHEEPITVRMEAGKACR
jgi:hypothetical protein